MEAIDTTIQDGQSLAIASLVVGTAGLASIYFYGIPAVLCGIISLVLASQAEKRIPDKSCPPVWLAFSKAGRALGTVAVILGLAFALFLLWQYLSWMRLVSGTDRR